MRYLLEKPEGILRIELMDISEAGVNLSEK